MRSTRVLLLAAAILAAGAGLVAYQIPIADRSREDPATELMHLRLPDTSGKDQNLAQWRDQVLIVNFWATWCEPCREEIPALVRAHAKYASNGVQIVGISLDSVDKVRQFAIDYRIGYPLVIGSIDVIDLTRKLGNKAGGLPYTVVMDRSGKVVMTHIGGVSEAQLESAIKLARG